MDKPGLVDWVIAPLTWLERSSGWRRGALLLLYGLIASTMALFGWRTFSLWRLPDIGEPFDEARYGTVEVADSANAMVLYREAAGRLVVPGLGNYKVASNKSWGATQWGLAEPEVRRWVEDNRPALATWLEAADRPDSLLVQPRDMSESLPLQPILSLPDFARLAILEASRLEEAGDVEGAWKLYRAGLRSSRHAGMHGGLIQRSNGWSILEITRAQVLRWADDPRVTAAMLRRAIADVEACREMTPPLSEMIRADYFAVRSTLDGPEVRHRYGIGGPVEGTKWYNNNPIMPTLRLALQREPERGHRVHRLVTAGVLAQCDRPRSARPRLVSPQYRIYAVDSQTPPALASITPEELKTWADNSMYSAVSGDQTFLLARIEAEPGLFDSLLLAMAERAYEVEHGRPPKTYGDLLDGYLAKLPEGIESGDSAGATQGPD